MVDIWKKLFPSIYQTPNFSKIDSEKEGILDFCPICQEPLPDKKIITFKKHEWEKHKIDDKEVSKRIKNNTKLIIGMMGFMVFFLGYPVYEIANIMTYDISKDATWTQFDECKMLSMNVKTRVYEDGKMMSDVHDMIDKLVAECNLRLDVTDSEMPIPLMVYPIEYVEDITLTPTKITDDTKSYDNNIEHIDELTKKKERLE